MMSGRGPMVLTLRNDSFSVSVDQRGAELQSVRYRERERLWQNENGGWAGHAPILFPVCGATAVRIDGRVYPCPFHGIARKATFSVAERGEAYVRLRLTSDAETLKQYPFAFRFDVIYTLEPDALMIAYEITNPETSELYASCGGHDSFALAEEVAAYELRFEKPECFESYLTDGDGHLTGETRMLGEGEVLDLATSLLEEGGSVCLDHLHSRAVALVRKATGETVAQVVFPETGKMVLWHPAGSRMLCIEPWQTLPDRVGETKDFSAKDGVLTVLPGGTVRVTRRILYGKGL